MTAVFDGISASGFFWGGRQPHSNQGNWPSPRGLASTSCLCYRQPTAR